MSRTGRAALLVALTGSAALAATVVVGPVSAEEDAGLTAVREASARYWSEQVALDDGFSRTDFCVEDKKLGFMGYHYVHHGRVDTQLVADEPEVVLYKQEKDGSRTLVGVEYLVIDDDQDLATVDDRPSLHGHVFDGPMPGHEPGMPVHYDLHVWAWQDNPAGAWSAWNTDKKLRCR